MGEIKDLLSKYGLKPSKGLGQNFLVDSRVLANIIKAAEVTPNDTILEIGPGLGVLTKELAKTAKQVIAIEKDKKLIEILQIELKEFSNLQIINEDALKFPDENLPTGEYKVVANIPYYITSPLIRKFLEAKNQPTSIVLMIQKEVAQRICEKPGNMNLLAVSVQFYGEPKIIGYVSKGSFWPSPKIDSAIIKIVPKKTRPPVDQKIFFKVVKAGFSQPRKQLLGNLSKGLKTKKEIIITWLEKEKISPTQRAETLSISNWINLAKNLQ